MPAVQVYKNKLGSRQRKSKTYMMQLKKQHEVKLIDLEEKLIKRVQQLFFTPLLAEKLSNLCMFLFNLSERGASVVENEHFL